MVLELVPKAPKPQAQNSSEAIVYVHTTMKGVQLGLVLGSTIGVLYSLIRLKRLMFSKIAQGINYGIIFGVVATDLMTYYRLSGSNLEKNQGRAYRIERNSNQNVIDNFTFGGMFLGQFTFAQVLSQNITKIAFMKIYTGGLIGFWLGAAYLKLK